jgi:hypothetical protein
MTASTEVEVRAPQGSGMLAKIRYAQTLADSGLLPTAYRRQPANVLYAVEYGEMLGLAPMAAITGIHIIEGKPSASAGLISGLVRRAGHKLRVHGDARSATCQIVRSDDPGYTFEVTFTMDDAKAAGLTGKPVWKNYPASMLKARAITQCARDACEEALYGLHYTPEELGADVDAEGEIVGEAQPQAPQAAAPADEWLEAALARIPQKDFTEDEGGKLWQQATAHRQTGAISAEDSGRVKELITARIEELHQPAGDDSADVVEGVVVEDPPPDLDPGDEWMSKVEEIQDGEDVAAARANLEVSRSKGMDPRRANQISAAIDARAATLESRAA